MRTKTKLPTHCCADCVFKETFKKGCVLKDSNFDKQLINEINKCPQWQN